MQVGCIQNVVQVAALAELCLSHCLEPSVCTRIWAADLSELPLGEASRWPVQHGVYMMTSSRMAEVQDACMCSAIESVCA